MTDFHFVVPGSPVGQGSMKHIGNGRMIASNDKKLREWRSAVVLAIQQEFVRRGDLFQFDGATKLDVWFCIDRPKTVKREFPVTPYDLDKLIRAVGDSCTMSGLVSDDAIFTDIVAKKRYANGCPYGAHITLSVI